MVWACDGYWLCVPTGRHTDSTPVWCQSSCISRDTYSAFLTTPRRVQEPAKQRQAARALARLAEEDEHQVLIVQKGALKPLSDVAAPRHRVSATVS